MTCMGDSLGNQMGVPAAWKWIQHTAKLCDKFELLTNPLAKKIYM